jgi:GNAT superfamily N-acetyltransferase
MTQTFSTPQVVCRPAIARDHVDVTEFCKGIWEGGDYVPDVWTHWYNDPNGILVTAEYKGHAIGCAKLSLIAKGQWWLEGFRVDPNKQGLKVGSKIHNYVVDWWLEHSDGAIRLMTDAGNLAVHHLCNRTGFIKTNEVCGYRATPIAEPTDNFSPITDAREAATFAMASESIKTTNGLIDFGWRICKPDEHAIENHSDHKADYFHTFYWWKDKQGLFSAWEDEDDEKRTLVIGVVACHLDDMPALLMDVRKLAAQKKFDSIFQIAFDIPQIVSQLEAAAFEKRWKRSNAFVFEREHPNRA